MIASMCPAGSPSHGAPFREAWRSAAQWAGANSQCHVVLGPCLTAFGCLACVQATRAVGRRSLVVRADKTVVIGLAADSGAWASLTITSTASARIDPRWQQRVHKSCTAAQVAASPLS